MDQQQWERELAKGADMTRARIDEDGFKKRAGAVLGRSFNTYGGAFLSVCKVYENGRPPMTGVPQTLWAEFCNHLERKRHSDQLAEAKGHG